jgi:hypothetical protein
MKKFYLLFLTMFLSLAVLYAQPKKVGYFTLNKTMDLSAASVQLDPVIRMLQADTNLAVTVNAILATDTADLAGYDVVVVQESFAGGGAYLRPGASLALDTFTVPVVYNKSYAFAAGRALAAGSTGGGAETEGTAGVSYVYLKVDPANQSNDLFKGISFDGDSVAIFKVSANDAGVTVTPDRFKALNYARNVLLLNSGGDTLKTTLLGKPARINPAHTNVTISFNDIPAGTKIGSETLKARMINLGMNFGAICGAYGSNITSAGLTIWRNAVYMGAGLTVPGTPVEFQKWKIGYFTLKGKVMDASAAPASQDPIITMLQENNDQWDLDVKEVAADSAFDLNTLGYNAIIVQESFAGGGANLRPGFPLALDTFPVPVLYNKSYAFAAGRALAAGATGGGAETEGKGFVYLKVDSANQANALFKGITFVGDSVAIFKACANDAGVSINSDRFKALNYARNVVLLNSGGDTLKTTLLAKPARINPAHTNITVAINDIPAGTKIGSETLRSRMITMGMNFGAICAAKGTNLTSAGLTLWRNAIHSALGLPVPTKAIPSSIPDIKVLLVTRNDTKDDIQFKFLTNNSLLAEKMYPSRPLGNITDSASLADTLTMLNAYDLVIIGRSCASTDFSGNSKTVWNSLKVPVILNSQYIARNTRINWLNSGDAKAYSSTEKIVKGKTLNVDDPIFAYSTLDADSTTDWSYLPDDIIAVTAPFNGDTVVYRDDAPLVVRFWADSAFYPGSADTVLAPRTYFGFGADANNFNYFPLTKSAQAAYYGEIMRITKNTVIEPLYYISDAASILSVTCDQPTYITPATFDPAVLAYTILIPKDVVVDSVQFLATASPLATITGVGVVQLTSDSVVHRIYAVAENKRVGDTYTFTIMKEKEVITPGFKDLAEAGITMFPNPANDNLTIEGLTENSSVRILNTVGQLVYSNLIKGSKAMINTSSFKNGVYIIQLEMSGKIVTTKFVKQ